MDKQYYVSETFTDTPTHVVGPFARPGSGGAVEHVLDVIYCDGYRITGMQQNAFGIYIIACKKDDNKALDYCAFISDVELHDALGTLVMYRG